MRGWQPSRSNLFINTWPPDSSNKERQLLITFGSYNDTARSSKFNCSGELTTENWGHFSMTTQQTLDSSTSWVEFITKYSTILINFAKLSKFLLKF